MLVKSRNARTSLPKRGSVKKVNRAKAKMGRGWAGDKKAFSQTAAFEVLRLSHTPWVCTAIGTMFGISDIQKVPKC